MNNYVFFSATTQFENLGDGIIGRELIKLMREKGQLIIDDRQAPDWYASLIGVESNESVKKNNHSFKRALIKNSFLSLLGKANVYWALKPGHHYAGFGFKREMVYLALMFFLKIMKVKVVRYGASVGPFDKFYLISERIKSRLMYDYTVRDGKSIEYCQNNGIKGARYFPDLALRLKFKNNFLDRKYTYALSFRESVLSGKSDNVKGRLDEVLEGFYTNTNYNEKSVCVSQVQRDDQYLVEISNKFSFKNTPVKFDLSSESCSEIFNTYAMSEYLLSNRLHGLLFAASQGAVPIPVIDKNQHMKIVGIYEDFGLADLIYDINGSKKLFDHVQSVAVDKKYWLSVIEKCFNDMQNYTISKEDV